VGAVTGQVPQIRWGEDATLTRLFGALPELDAAEAAALGFCADPDLIALTKNALEGVLP
jgi:D-erythronate 2-dehydrogenase